MPDIDELRRYYRWLEEQYGDMADLIKAMYGDVPANFVDNPYYQYWLNSGMPEATEEIDGEGLYRWLMTGRGWPGTVEETKKVWDMQPPDYKKQAMSLYEQYQKTEELPDDMAEWLRHQSGWPGSYEGTQMEWDNLAPEEKSDWFKEYQNYLKEEEEGKIIEQWRMGEVGRTTEETLGMERARLSGLPIIGEEPEEITIRGRKIPYNRSVIRDMIDELGYKRGITVPALELSDVSYENVKSALEQVYGKDWSYIFKTEGFGFKEAYLHSVYASLVKNLQDSGVDVENNPQVASYVRELANKKADMPYMPSSTYLELQDAADRLKEQQLKQSQIEKGQAESRAAMFATRQIKRTQEEMEGQKRWKELTKRARGGYQPERMVKL